MARAHLATLVANFRRHSGQAAIVTYRGNRRFSTSYAALARLAENVAAELTRREIRSGDRVILWGQNSAAWVAAFFACVLRGVIAVPLDAAGSADFIHRVIVETTPRLVVGDPMLLSQIKVDIATLSFAELPQLPRSTVPLPPVILNGDTPLQILFTSGTTAAPKGIVHTHRNVLASLEPIEREIQKYLRYERFVHPLRFLHTLPLSHVFGQFMGLWIPPLLAAEVHFESRAEPARIIETIHRERISLLAVVPRVLDLVKSHLASSRPQLSEQFQSAQQLSIMKRWWRFREIHRLFGLKFWALVSGGASLPAELERFWNTLGFALIQGYGMTETAALITLNHPFRIGKGTIGKPLPGREVRIGEDGEVLVRGEMVSNSTWQNGELRQREDPWLATGDLVSQDEQGQLRFLGRKSDVIVTASGLNIHPEDIEAALNRQPGIEASAVIAFTAQNGNEPAAAILAPVGKQAAEAAVLAANRQLADYQRIRNWRLWPEADLPRTSTGKVQRRKVAAWFASQNDTNTSTNTEDPLLNLIAAISGAPSTQIDDDVRLDEDLHLDSLGKVQLQSALEERFGAAIDDRAFSQIETLGQLRAAAGWQSTPLPSTTPLQPSSMREQETAPISSLTPTRAQHPAKFRYPRWPWSRPVRLLRVAFLNLIIRPLTRFLATPKVTAPPPAALPVSPMLIIANHVTAFDVPLVLYALPARIRNRVVVAMSGEMLEDWRHARNQPSWWQNLLAPLQYWLVTALFNVFPLPRSAGFRQSFAHAGRALDHGYNVLVFPEGQRSSDGALQPFRAGIGLLAIDSQTAVLPIGLKGIGAIKQQRSRWFRSGKIEVHVGLPITISSQLKAEEIAAALQNAVRALIE